MIESWSSSAVVCTSSESTWRPTSDIMPMSFLSHLSTRNMESHSKNIDIQSTQAMEKEKQSTEAWEEKGRFKGANLQIKILSWSKCSLSHTLSLSTQYYSWFVALKLDFIVKHRALMFIVELLVFRFIWVGIWKSSAHWSRMDFCTFIRDGVLTHWCAFFSCVKPWSTLHLPSINL